MAKSTYKYIKYLCIAIVCFLAFLLWPKQEKETGHPRDFHEIKESGKLRVATEYNAINFFVDGDTLSECT